MPGGDAVAFGYERDLDVSMLEERGVLDHPTPDGWTSSRVLCRSGQSTLSAAPPRHLDGRPAALSPECGRYFEQGARRRLAPTSFVTPAAASAVDPPGAVFCDGHFGVSDPRALPRTTCPASRYNARRHGCRLVALVRSLRWSACRSVRSASLDQADGLASVGITQLVREGTTVAAADLASYPRPHRSGLTLGRLAALGAVVLDLLAGLRSRDIRHNAASAAPSVGVGGLRGAVTLRWSAPAPKRRSAVRLRGGDGPAHRRCWKSSTPRSSAAGCATRRPFGFAAIVTIIEPDHEEVCHSCAWRWFRKDGPRGSSPLRN
jgi:hypothetical protein